MITRPRRGGGGGTEGSAVVAEARRCGSAAACAGLDGGWVGDRRRGHMAIGVRKGGVEGWQ
jgi:hypothetical protein